MKLCTSFFPSIFVVATLMLGSCSAQVGGLGRRFRDPPDSGTGTNNGGTGTQGACSTNSGAVCGGNGITYSNSCLAWNDGQNWSPGSCNSNNGGGCSRNIDRVCGRNGRTYDNACLAEEAGQRNYSSGSCSDWSNTRSYSVRGATGTYTFQRDDGE